MEAFRVIQHGKAVPLPVASAFERLHLLGSALCGPPAAPPRVGTLTSLSGTLCAPRTSGLAAVWSAFGLLPQEQAPDCPMRQLESQRETAGSRSSCGAGISRLIRLLSEIPKRFALPTVISRGAPSVPGTPFSDRQPAGSASHDALLSLLQIGYVLHSCRVHIDLTLLPAAVCPWNSWATVPHSQVIISYLGSLGKVRVICRLPYLWLFAKKGTRSLWI